MPGSTTMRWKASPPSAVRLMCATRGFLGWPVTITVQPLSPAVKKKFALSPSINSWVRFA